MKILVIADTQVKPDVDTRHLDWIGKSIVEERPDVIVHIGDHFDMSSLSVYDMGKKAAEGRRFSADLVAGQQAMLRLLRSLKRLQRHQRKHKKKVYRPRMEFMLGNHEERVARHVESHAQLEGLIDYPDCFGLEKHGWTVNTFLEPINIGGINFAHYFYNPNSGRPFGGTAHTKLRNVGESFVMGHVQGLDMAFRTTNAGSKQLGVVAGSCYLHEEGYKGPQANEHWNGIVYLDNVTEGDADVRPLRLSTLEKLYANK
ncbi:calcineurin-like phosphoesterase [Vibrio phage 1.293.O._10N.261.52.E1]|nr:calcineurin-like phosphoesterase [Vibrio phage 1.293.O._10N.261.52.E1]